MTRVHAFMFYKHKATVSSVECSGLASKANVSELVLEERDDICNQKCYEVQ